MTETASVRSANASAMTAGTPKVATRIRAKGSASGWSRFALTSRALPSSSTVTTPAVRARSTSRPAVEALIPDAAANSPTLRLRPGLPYSVASIRPCDSERRIRCRRRCRYFHQPHACTRLSKGPAVRWGPGWVSPRAARGAAGLSQCGNESQTKRDETRPEGVLAVLRS